MMTQNRLSFGGLSLFVFSSERITIQDDQNGRRISIRAARDWSLLFLSIWLAMWTTLPIKTVLAAVRSLARPESMQLFDVLWSLGWLVAICVVVSHIAWGLGGQDLLILSPTELHLSSTLFGISIRRRDTPTSEVRNLRFMPSYRRGRGRAPSNISFEDSRGTVKFASALDDSDALAVIEAMLAVYPFPKRDRALEYLDLGQ